MSRAKGKPKKHSPKRHGNRSAPVVPTVTPADLDRLIAGVKYRQHPYGKVSHRLDLPTFNALVHDIAHRGQDKTIIRYQGMILDGWHRYLASLAAKVQPTFEEFSGTDLEAAELANASEVRRHSTPEQRYASFLLLCEACPEFGIKYEQLKVTGEQQQKKGKPLSTDGQRVDVLAAKAAAQGVGRSTAAKVEQVKKHKPKAIAEIAAGKTTANKELEKIKWRGEPQFISMARLRNVCEKFKSDARQGKDEPKAKSKLVKALEDTASVLQGIACRD